MKKYILLFLFLSICFVTQVSAQNYCTPKADEEKWEFVEISYESYSISQETENTLIKCCTDGARSYVCDHYKAKATSGGGTSDITGAVGTNVNWCSGLKSTFVFFGHLVRLAKILIPIIIIAYGMIDFFHAIVGSKDDQLKKAIRSLLFRAIAGVAIFFLPAVIDLVFSWVDGWSNNYESSYKECFQCIWNVGQC